MKIPAFIFILTKGRWG